MKFVLLSALLSFGMMHAGVTDILCCDMGSFGLEVRAGVDPVVFSNRQQTFTVTNSISATEGRLDELFPALKFSDMFKTPWIVAGQLNWDINDCHSSFLELNYTRANGECLSTNFSLRTGATPAETTGTLQLSYGDFSMFGAYLGHRYYWNMWDCAPIYFGGKIGLGHFKDICLNIIRTEPNPNVYNVTNTAYEKQTVVSGGLQVGIDYSFWSCASFLFQAEVVASGALSNSIDKFVFPAANSVVGATNNIIGKTGTLVSFPVTVGLSFEW